MRVLFISASDLDYDGRTRALIRALSGHAELVAVTATAGDSHREGDNYYVHMRGIRDYPAYIRAVTGIARRAAPIDCIFADNRRATVPALKLRRLLAPELTIYDARELYLPGEVKGLSGRIGCRYEGKMIALADHVICCNRQRREIMEKEFRHRGDFLVFDNFRRLSYSGNADMGRLEAEYGGLFDTGSFRMISTAGSEAGRGAPELVRAAERLDFPWELYITGCRDDRDTDLLRAYTEKQGLSRVHIMPRLDQDRLKYVISRCDLGIAMYHKRNANNLYCSSGKIYEFIYEGLPVAMTDNPPLAEVAARYGVGSAKADIADAIKEVYSSYDVYKKHVEEFAASGTVERAQQEFADELGRILGGR